jgi:hypothetical protein
VLKTASVLAAIASTFPAGAVDAFAQKRWRTVRLKKLFPESLCVSAVLAQQPAQIAARMI